ncbi:hypothetical protein D9619_009891 [Psilocybe cf. subviscida]|uniref:Uncharacterized protein n=1 Tax=Psilocybe cf. subviscida TaxID=2480587 RepID=A0A8H5BKH4_9AGAR|nr:hypothetical protein D9619_009891 [Psilocybe cf. subviscida]
MPPSAALDFHSPPSGPSTAHRVIIAQPYDRKRRHVGKLKFELQPPTQGHPGDEG